MKLVHENTGKPVRIGDKVQSFRGEKAAVVWITEPHKPESTGRVTVRWRDGGHEAQYFPGVFNLHWTERTDQGEQS